MNIPTPAQLQKRHTRRDPRQGFTLIELLVVIAITAVLFFLMVRPLIEGLRLTQRAQLQAAAQDSARKTLEIVTRELSSAVYVFDNASHPFVLPKAATFASTDDRFTNFLNLDVPTKTGTTVAHAYYAKLDLVPARHSNATGGLTDPTNGDQPIKVSGTSLNDTGLLFPLAPGSTIIRYFTGLKNPEDHDAAANIIRRPYANTNERLGTGSTDNTYILYRAQVTVSNAIDTTTGKPAANADLTTVNEQLFAPQHDASGNPINKPELDDPDFFRIVSTSDTNWLSANHSTYSLSDAAAHNTRVDNWYKLAKPVITAPNIDLLLLPRNPDGTVRFDSNGNPGSGSTTDPLNAGTSYPTVGTSVTFQPATVSADAAPNASSDYAGAGVPLNARDALGLPYIPTVYTASAQSWGYPYHISLYPLHNLDSANNPVPNGMPTYDARFPSFTTDTDRSGATADMIEYENSAPANSVAVYDITQNTPATASTHNYVPMIVNPDTGTISFAVPALPFPGPPVDTANAKDLYNRFFKVTVGDMTNVNSINGYAVAPGVIAPGLIDLADNTGTQFATVPFKNTPLASPGTAPSGAQVANAHLVPGSVRVYGPDATPGPTQGTRTLYTPVAPGGALGYNQYRIDYLNSTLTLYVDAQHLLTTTGSATGTPAAEPNIEIAFDYQSNLAPTVNSLLDIGTSNATAANSAITAANPAQPMQVKVDYPTRDLLDINIGVRVYDPTNGQAFTVPVSNRVKVNNSHR